MFDTVTDFYLFTLNMFTTQPFWTLWWQPPGEKKNQTGQILGRIRRQRAESMVDGNPLLIDFSGYRS